MQDRKRDDIVQEMIKGLRRGNYFSVLGPRYSGKTTVLHKLAETVQQDPFIKCFFWEANEKKSTSKTKNLYNELKKLIRSRLLEEYNRNQAFNALNPKFKDDVIKLTRKRVSSCEELQDLLYKILDNNDFRMVLVLNRLQHLPKHVTRSLLTCLREIYNKREEKTHFKRLNVIISGSSNLLEFTKGEKSPFNISHPISLPHLTKEEAETRLLTYTEHNVFCPRESRDYLLHEFNNHPYFINKITSQLLYVAHRQGIQTISPEFCKKFLGDFIAKNITESNDRYIKEMTFRLRDDLDIFETILTMLDKEEAKGKKPEKGASKYYLSGAMIFSDGKLNFTNNLVRRYLSQYLNDLTKGDIYISFSEWDKAIAHYQKFKKRPAKDFDIFSANRLDTALNSVIALINKCLENDKIWTYFADTLYYIFHLNFVEIFEKTSKTQCNRIFHRNGSHTDSISFHDDDESLIQYACESQHYVLSDGNEEAAFPIQSWDEQKQWIVLAGIPDLKAVNEDERAEKLTALCKIIERFLRITISAIDRIKANFDVFDMLGEEVSIVDRDFNIIYMNKIRRERFGKNFRLEKGVKCYKKLAGYQHSPEDDSSESKKCRNCPALGAFQESEQTKKMARTKTDDACLEKIGDKESYLLQTSLTLRDEYGKFTRALNVSHDITKIQKVRDLVDEVFHLQQEGDLANLFMKILERLQSMGYERIRFYEYYKESEQKELLILKYHLGMDRPERLNGFIHNISRLGFLQNTFKTRETVLHTIDKEKFGKDSWEWIDTLELDKVKVLFIPIYDNGRPYGLLGVDNKNSDRDLNEEDKRLISSLTRYIVASIQNLSLAKRQKVLYEITSELHNYATVKSLLPKIAEAIVKNCEVRKCSVFLYNKYKNQLVRWVTKVKRGNVIKELALEESYAPGESITGKIYEEKKSRIIHNLHQYPGDLREDYIRQTEVLLKEELKNCLFVPIVSENEIKGIIRICNRLDENGEVSSIGFKEDEVILLEHIGKQLGLAISKIQTSHNILWQTSVISSTLRTIQSVERKFLQQFKVERYSEALINDLFDKVYFIILTGLTIKSPFGYNRAILFRLENDHLLSKRAIGPADQQSADVTYNKDIWIDLMEEEKKSPYDKIMEKVSANYDRYRNFFKPTTPEDRDIFLSSEFDALVKSIDIKDDDEIYEIFHATKEDRNFIYVQNDLEYRRHASPLLSKIKAYNWMILPLIIEDRTQGLIFVDNKYNKRPISEDDIDALKQFLDRISITLSKLEALKAQIKQSRIQYSQFKIVKVLTQQQSMTRNVNVIQTELKKVLPHVTNICLLQKKNSTYKRISNCPNKHDKKSCKDCERADRTCLNERQEYYCRDKSSDPYFKDSPGDFRSRYLVKLKYDEEELGILDIDSELPDAFSQNDLQIIQNVTHQLSVEMIKAKVSKEKDALYRDREQMIRDKEQSFSEIAHDMKTPLVGVKNLSLNVIEMDLDEEDLNENLILIANEAKRVLKFTNQILDLAKLEYKKQDFSFTTNSMNDIVGDAIEDNGIYAKTKSTKIIGRKTTKTIYAEVDKESLTKAVAQIIENAIKYSDENSRVLVKLTESRKYAKIEVRDNGIGIPRSEVKKIYKKHERGKNAQNFTSDGIGIGLTIVDLIVKAHQGKIKIKSEAGEGSTFTIYIPKVRRRDNGQKATAY
ncbi:MAG: GAF domain-containing protein [candidate division KSB1 bacterium]|jgi:K+-sensing histidine kinase KdpD|nr:GAF domain-containing protein [candidate division KSB1 bacterium]